MKKKNVVSISALIKKAQAFTDARNWDQFHTLKNLAMNLTIEAGELMEFFVWRKSDVTIDELSDQKVAIEDEVGDVFLSLLLFCEKANIDLASAYLNKLEKTSEKYPAEEYKGKTTKQMLRKYDEKHRKPRN